MDATNWILGPAVRTGTVRGAGTTGSVKAELIASDGTQLGPLVLDRQGTLERGQVGILVAPTAQQLDSTRDSAHTSWGLAPPRLGAKTP
jgi:hypothetical protein